MYLNGYLFIRMDHFSKKDNHIRQYATIHVSKSWILHLINVDYYWTREKTTWATCTERTVHKKHNLENESKILPILYIRMNVSQANTFNIIKRRLTKLQKKINLLCPFFNSKMLKASAITLPKPPIIKQKLWRQTLFK